MGARRNNPNKYRPQDKPVAPTRQHPVDPLEPPTAPYTFVPFAPTVTADQLWPEDSDDPTRAFDRLLPGMHTGHLDLTITALTPIHVGPHTDGHPFRWPGGKDAHHAIPAYSLRGMVRAELSTVLGGALGLPAGYDIPILERYPVRGGKGDIAQIRHTTYKNRRGLSAHIGKQRVGLLFWDGRSETAHVVECPQQQLGNRRKVPSVQWEIVRRDLLNGSGASGDLREALERLRGERVYVVWASVRVGKVPRPVVFAIGRGAASAQTNAGNRHSGGKAGLRIVAPLPHGYTDHEFLGYLDGGWHTTTGPFAQPMTFFPTNLANLDAAGIATTRARTRKDKTEHRARNCYLLAPVGSVLSSRPKGTYRGKDGRIPVDRSALTTLGQVLQGRYWKNFPRPQDQVETGWPVFFDESGGRVTFLGGSGGFPIAATHTVADTVADSPASWSTRIGTPIRTSDAVVTLLGAVDGDDQIAARLGIGHATTVTGVTPLTARPVALLSPNPQAAHTRLIPEGGESETGTGDIAPVASIDYSNTAPKYRGRERYWHHWPADGSATGDREWRKAVSAHENLALEVSDKSKKPAVDDEVSSTLAPLPIGTTFTARLTFTNLTDAELGALLFVLRFPAAADPGGPPALAHKLGGGQPLGLGSVAITADLFRHTPDRYLSLSGDGIVPDDGAAFIAAFRDSVGWTPDHAENTWRHDPVTGESWPEHVAAWLTAARWSRRPEPEATAEVGVSRHRGKIPMLGVFDIGDKAP